MYFTWMNDTPVGRLLVAGDQAGLRFVLFESDPAAKPQTHEGWEPGDRHLKEPVRQLKAYFAGRLTDFELDLAGEGTAFQKKVWNALLKIPYGTTASYGSIAASIGKPTASRAVGMANGRNPISIVVPCHRIIGANGQLTGYGGGLHRKRTLLDLERSVT